MHIKTNVISNKIMVHIQNEELSKEIEELLVL